MWRFLLKQDAGFLFTCKTFPFRTKRLIEDPFTISKPNAEDVFRIRYFFNGLPNIDAVIKGPQSPRILGWISQEPVPYAPKNIRLSVHLKTNEQRPVLFRALVNHWFAQTKPHFPTQQIITPPIDEQSNEMREWKALGFVIKEELREVQFMIDKVSHFRINDTVNRLRRLGKIPSEVTIKAYTPQYLPELKNLLCPLGLIGENELTHLTHHPHIGLDRDLSALVLYQNQIIGCLLVNVPHQHTCHLHARFVHPKYRKGLNWTNALLFHHLATRARARQLPLIRYRFNPDSMPESGNLASRSIIPSHHISTAFVLRYAQ